MSNQKENKTVLEISSGSIIKVFLFLFLAVSLYYIRDVVAIVLFAIVIASAVEPAARWFENKKLPRVLAVILVYLLMFTVLGSLFYLVIPTFISEMSDFSVRLPQYLEDPNEIREMFSFLPISDGSFSTILQETVSTIQEQIGKLATGFFQAVASLFGGALSFFLMIIISFYLAVQKNGLENFLRIIVPAHHEDYALSLLKRSRKKIGRWLQGQVLLGILVGVLVFLGLTILQVEYALVFALLAAVFELIPVFGPVLASIPPIVVAFLANPTTAIFVIILFVIIQQFENHLIYPLVVRKIIGIPPIVVILSIIVGGKLGGFFGVVLAIPIATVLIEFLNDVAAKKSVKLKK